MSRFTAPPVLDHDTMMRQKFGSKVSPNGMLERAIVWNLLGHMESRGWRVTKVDDGFATTEVADAKAAMELIFNLDEAYVWLTNARGIRHYVLLVMGNGDLIISDYSYRLADADGFVDAMEAFDADEVAPALLTIVPTT